MAFVPIFAEEQNVSVQRGQLVVAEIQSDVLQIGEGQIPQQAFGQFADVCARDSQHEVGCVIKAFEDKNLEPVNVRLVAMLQLQTGHLMQTRERQITQESVR